MSFPLFDFLFPVRSLRGREGMLLTPEEIASLTSHPRLFSCPELQRMGLKHLECVRVASTYVDCPLLRRAVWALKYDRRTSYAPILANLLCPLLPQRWPEGEQVVLCPVPLHWQRLFRRGFNQSALLAVEVHRRTGLPIGNLLRRRCRTGTQVGRTRQDRGEALLGAFEFTKVPPRGARVILVDDLFTTGATLEECARILREGGASRVEGLVVAHG